MADIPIQDYVWAAGGLAASFAAAAAGDTVQVADGERIAIEVTNGSGASINVTVAAVTTSVYVPGAGPVSVSNMTMVVTAGSTKRLGPIPEAFVDQSTGRASISYSATTSVTRAAFRIPPPA